MIVNKERTDAQRDAYAAALLDSQIAPNEACATAAAIDKYPYMAERIVRITMKDKKTFSFKVLAHDDDFAAGTLMFAGPKGSRWSFAGDNWINAFDAKALRKIADLLDNPLEVYVAPKLPIPQADGQETA
jgi:hypothetical protein